MYITLLRRPGASKIRRCAHSDTVLSPTSAIYSPYKTQRNSERFPEHECCAGTYLDPSVNVLESNEPERSCAGAPVFRNDNVPKTTCETSISSTLPIQKDVDDAVGVICHEHLLLFLVDANPCKLAKLRPCNALNEPAIQVDYLQTLAHVLHN
mmetsp:Transcript_396/g.723  ORF Transcript_396/g.723 Transcript_396/m.723 type:complete len:153 (+) Transcript_396:120-578(+)